MFKKIVNLCLDYFTLFEYNFYNILAICYYCQTYMKTRLLLRATCTTRIKVDWNMIKIC